MTNYIEITLAGDMIIDEFLKPLNMSMEDLSQALDVDIYYIEGILTNNEPITKVIDERLCDLFGMSQGYFLRYQEGVNFRLLNRK